MIKVFYDGYGVYFRPASNRIGLPKAEKMHGDDFFMPDWNIETLNQIGEVVIDGLKIQGIDNMIALLSDKDGNLAPIKIIKGQNTYIEKNGNVLKLIFDDEPVPQPATESIEEKPLSETERQTMLKLIYGMAIAFCDYSPEEKRNNATGNNKNSISAKLALHGVNVSDATIRKYLNEAKKLCTPIN